MTCRLGGVASGVSPRASLAVYASGPFLYFTAITLLRSLAPGGSAERQFAQRYGLVVLAASHRAWRDLCRQRERAFAPAMAGRQERERAAAISGAWPSPATPDRAPASPAKGSIDQERSSLTAQTVGAAAGPERHSA